MVMTGGIADQMGAIMTAYGILTALLVRERLGIGQKVDVSHLGSMMALQGLYLGIWLYLRPEPREGLTRKNTPNPLWNYYQCQDETWLMLGMLQPDRQWPAVCKALGIERLEHDPRFEDQIKRAENSEEIIATMDDIFITKTASEWVKILKEAGDVICTPVQRISDLINDPQVLANNYIIDYNHEVLGAVQVPGIPVAFSKTPGTVKSEAPEFGQHTEEVLLEMGGYSWEEITELKDKEVI
jgi:crotonobetainyl-CoA:carnitine CoA-transferase CaiB-like acyl-CoA transferase